MNETVTTVQSSRDFFLPPELVDLINSITITDIQETLDAYEGLSQYFSIIPVHRFSTLSKSKKAPIQKNWTRFCYKKALFDKKLFIANNAGVACGPASGVIVLDIDNEKLFDLYLQQNDLTFDDPKTFVVETGSGNRHYYFQYPIDGFKYGIKRFGNDVIDEYNIKYHAHIFDIIGCDGQVLAPGSVHPDTFKNYKILYNNKLLPAPDWLLNLSRNYSKLIYNQNTHKQHSEGTVRDETNNTSETTNTEPSNDHQFVQLNDSSPQARFKNHFDNVVRWGSAKQIDSWSNPAEAFNNAEYLLFPGFKRCYMCFDLDWGYSATKWLDEGLPEPTITIINPTNNHSNIAYELKDPVFWPCDTNIKKISYKPVAYLNAIRFAYTKLLNADTAYTNASIKNPFSTKWKVTWHDKTYKLNELANFVILPSKREQFSNSRNSNYSGRNQELFNLLRKWSYKNVNNYSTDSEFNIAAINCANELNSGIIITHWPERGSLPNSEVLSIAKGVSSWTWLRKNDPNLKYLVKNYGAMKFDLIPVGIDVLERKQLIYDRQAEGAKYVHSLRKNATIGKINDAIEKLKLYNTKITLKSISNYANISYSNIKKYKQYILNIIK